MNKTLAIYKPKGPTSFQVIREFQRVFGKDEKIGHAGTLDPLASGILVIALGREATKKLSDAVGAEKEYVAEITLGATSDTEDMEGEIIANSEAKDPGMSAMQSAVSSFAGKVMQLPSAHSALKVNGKRAYELARKGKETGLEPREVEIKEIEILGYKWPKLRIRVVTGPGVYIRALARDIGEKLRVGAYLSELERTRVGSFRKEDSMSAEEAIKKIIENKE